MDQRIESRKKLAEVFGYHQFREGQEEIITSILNKQDNLIIMPTGGGKSLCYQLPALLMKGMTLVISPLIALMEDQVAALKQLGVNAAAIHSNLSLDEKQSLTNDIDRGELTILYLSPETVLQPRFLDFLRNKCIPLIAIDEAHCVSIWGNDFRPEYTKLKQLRECFPAATLVALTATADAATRFEMLEKLALKEPKVSIMSFERHNIYLQSLPAQNRMAQIRRFLNKFVHQSGIIYTLSRNTAEKTAHELEKLGYKSAYYHAGMDALSRSRIQSRFQNDEIHIICATIAFGMGIDKSNVRFVIHYNLPKNIESYYQEIGRAGRDNLPSEALLFHSWADVTQLRKFIENSDSELEYKEIQSDKLDRMWQLGSGFNCRTNVILNYFGEYRHTPCGHCDICLSPPKRFDGTIIAQKVISAISRCQEQLTLTNLMDVLKGTIKPELREKGFHEIKTFGAGRDLSYPEWREYLTQIIQLGIVEIDYARGSLLRLTPLAHDVLQMNRIIELHKYLSPSLVTKKRRTSDIPLHPDDHLFEKLRIWRAHQASQQRIPAYTIFHDKTLKHLSDQKPLFWAALDNIEGIGQLKKEKYGHQIIRIIEEYMKEQ